MKLKKREEVITIGVAVLAVVLIIVAVVGGWLIYDWMTGAVFNHRHLPVCSLNITQNESFWIVTVTGVSAESPEDLKETEIEYVLYCKNGTVESASLKEINEKPSPGYNVTWLDKDKNNMLSEGDVFLISKSGGTLGGAEAGDTFVLVYVYTGGALTQDVTLI